MSCACSGSGYANARPARWGFLGQSLGGCLVALLAGLYDDLDFVIPIVPPEHPGTLWRHWGEPAIHGFHGGHLASFGRAGIVDAVVRHLEGVGIL